MGFFDRISALWKGTANQAISDIENNNPEAVYEAAIASREKRYQELKKATAGITMLRNKTEEDLQKASKELERVEGMIMAAVQGGEDDAALVLLQEKSSLTSAIETHTSNLETLKTQSEDSMASLRQFQAELEKLKAEKHEMLAKVRTADAQVHIQDTITGLSQDGDTRGLANVRESIGRLAAEADGAAVDGASTRLNAQAKKKLAQANAQAELDALKAAMQGKTTPSETGDNPPADSNDEPSTTNDSDTPKRTL